MQLNIQPQNFVPAAPGAAPELSSMKPGSQYSGPAYVNTGSPMQQAPQGLGIGVAPAATTPGPYMQNGVMTTHTVHQTGAENERAEVIPTPPIPAGQAARLSIGMGFTKNLGDYQSFRATVTVELPWPADKVQQGLDECQRIATERMFKMWNEG